MVLYLTDNTSPDEIRAAADCGFVFGCKYYPAGATTNSDSGVTNLDNIDSVLEAMQEVGMVLQIHGEVTDPDVDIFDREAVFIERHLIPLRRQFPQLRVVFEHITTEQAAQFVADGDPLMAATITPHHLHINRNAMFQGGLRSDFYCLPVAKRERHRLALRQAATSGDPSFFLGTDSAPHPRAGKESSCGCAGIYNAPYALESYLAVFEAEGALQHFEAFASENGPRFYKLPLNEGTITLERTAQLVPAQLEGQGLVPFHASEVLDWRLAD